MKGIVPDLHPLWEILKDLVRVFDRLAAALEEHNAIQVAHNFKDENGEQRPTAGSKRKRY